jgi:hypothetical protein
MKRVLIVFTTCSPNPNKSIKHWHTNFNKLLEQDLEEFDVDYVISDCLSSPNHLAEINNILTEAKSRFPYRRVCFIRLNTPIPVQMSFNYTCKDMTERYGHYDYYFYYPSDISFDNPQALKNIFDSVEEEDGIVCPGNVSDLPYMGSWASFQRYESNGSKVSLPISYACNAVCLIFNGNYAKKYYYKPWCDILKTNCSEILLTYCCAAIRKKYSVIKNVQVNPGRNEQDGPTLFSRPNINDVCSIIHIYPFNNKYDFRKIIKEGQKFGLGFDEYPEKYPHNPECYDGIFSKTDELYNYISNNLYVKKEDFDYDNKSLCDFKEISINKTTRKDEMENTKVKVLLVFNTCSPNKLVSAGHWHRTFDNALKQNTSGGFIHGNEKISIQLDYIISDDMSAKNHLVDIRYMLAKAKVFNPESNVCANSLRVPVGLPTSFNYACNKMVKLYGEYDYYVMWPSDVFFKDLNSLTNLIAVLYTHKEGGIVSPGNSDELLLGDNEYSAKNYRYNPNGTVNSVPVGESCSTSFLIFSKEYAEKYNFKPWADIIQSYCASSLLTFQAAAIKKSWLTYNAVKLETQGFGRDGACLLSRDEANNILPMKTFSDNQDIYQIIKDGYNVGLGFKELEKIHPHNPECYEGLFTKTSKLHKYILNNLYIKKEEFDYDNSSISEFNEIKV